MNLSSCFGVQALTLYLCLIFFIIALGFFYGDELDRHIYRSNLWWCHVSQGFLAHGIKELLEIDYSYGFWPVWTILCVNSFSNLCAYFSLKKRNCAPNTSLTSFSFPRQVCKFMQAFSIFWNEILTGKSH